MTENLNWKEDSAVFARTGIILLTVRSVFFIDNTGTVFGCGYISGAEGACLFWHMVLLYAALQLQGTGLIKQFSIR